MMEDDCDIGTVQHWPFSWKDFYRKTPYDYDVIQLAVINPAQIHFTSCIRGLLMIFLQHVI